MWFIIVVKIIDEFFLFLVEEQDDGSVGLSKAAVVGISVGSVVLGLVLCLLLIFCYRKRKSRRPYSRRRPQRKSKLKDFVLCFNYSRGFSGIYLYG